ncbi:hypothetical protein ACFWQ6_00700 [Streptomyces coelicoflavus]|uniref:hypothetical protein n=1 Tax=Streptomyces coelicoflavus TaxID=285562 RepID=UPI0036633AA2
MADLAGLKGFLPSSGPLIGYALTASANGACRATVAGIEITTRVVSGVTVGVGDTILIVRRGSTFWVIAIAGAAPTVPPVEPAPDDTPPDTGDSAPAPKPTVTTGSLTCHPVATSTWRSGHWRTDIGSSTSADTYQGRYGYSSYGRNSGFAFYGSKPRSLAGATVTKATVKLRRLTSGDYGRRSPTLRLVSESSRPSSYPSLHESTTGPSLGVRGHVSPSETTFTLPTSWGQAMVDGSRGGLGIVISADSPYIRLAGRSSWSAAWTLTLYWRRSG